MGGCLAPVWVVARDEAWAWSATPPFLLLLGGMIMTVLMKRVLINTVLFQFS